MVPAIPDLDLKRITLFCEKHSPPEFRDQLRVEARVRGKSVTLFDCRPPYGGTSPEWTEAPFGQLRYDPETAKWTLYWSDRNDRWHLYDLIEPGTVVDLLGEIDRDPTCIFWG